MNQNQQIHEWLGKCWHESNGVGTLRDGGYYCKKCGDSNALAPFPAEWNENGNPNYDSNPASMLALIEALRANGYENIQMATDTLNGEPHGYYCNIAGGLHDPICDANGPTLPEAVAKAVIALIESEEQL